MTQSQGTVETDFRTIANGVIATQATVLAQIHREQLNIAIYERDTSALTAEINALLPQDIHLRASGDKDTILQELQQWLDPNAFSLIIEDIKTLLQHFQATAGVQQLRLLLATIHSNMCRKFHTDINDLRMLCTYSGPGTLWLTDDNINREALQGRSDNDSIVIAEDKVQQVKTGAVVLLKGAIYPQEESKAVVHRSPTIEESGERRLLLRIDTNETGKLWG